MGANILSLGHVLTQIVVELVCLVLGGLGPGGELGNLSARLLLHAAQLALEIGPLGLQLNKCTDWRLIPFSTQRFASDRENYAFSLKYIGIYSEISLNIFLEPGFPTASSILRYFISV